MYKKVNVVILPTDEKAEIRLNSSLNLISKDISDYGVDSNTYISCQHLYIVSDDEIKEGDWYIANHNVEGYILSDKKILCKADKNFIINHYIKNSKMHFKVVATTDISLWEHDDTVPYPKTRPALPQIPQQFIEHYVNEYNKGNVITEVMVEFDEVLGKYSKDIYDTYFVPKIDQDNTINIKPVKDSWNRDEVIELCKKAYDDGFHQGTLKDSPCKDNSFWIEENL